MLHHLVAKVVPDLVGDLSLLAEPGHVGVPMGHVVAYKAGHELHAKFAAKVKEAIRKAENVASMEDAILKEEAQAAERKRRQAAVKRARKKVDDEAEAG